MLDEKTLEWIKSRENLCTRCAVKNCIMPNNKNRILGSCEWFEVKAPESKTGKLREDYRDAAEFEARVAIEMTELAYITMTNYDMIKYARLSVEYEMIQEGKGPGKPEEMI